MGYGLNLRSVPSWEATMPGKRPDNKGSFGGHFDELVKHFPDERPNARPDKNGGGKNADDRCVHDRLFENARAKPHGTRHRPAR